MFMEKRVNKYISLLFGLLVATSGCTDEFETENLRNDILLPGEYKFVLVNDAPQSRVSYENEISSVFETGDRIGVFATNSERQIQNDVFSARNMESNELIQVLAPPKGDVTQDLDTEIPDPGSQTPPPNYIFYFPMNEKWKLSDMTKGTGFSYNVESDQSTKENYQKSDFLWNYLTPDPDAAYQTVNMHHLMANIVVKIHKDSIDTSENPVTGKPKGITLKNMQTNATRIYFETQQSGDMGYSPDPNTKSDIEMYCQGTSGEYMIYRAAVPAWTTKKADEEIFTVTLYDRNGNSETVTYKLGEDLSMKDGHYYMFTLSSAVKPAIPDVGDDDSWVLDVFDPESGEIVGLLCREYLRYQPKVGRTDAEYITGTPYNDTKYVLSQAWVFYNLKEGYESEKIINLDKGTIVRFIYDLRTSNKDYTNYTCISRWPRPHIGTDGGGGGMFAVDHGHVWAYDSQDYNTNSGHSSDLYQWKDEQYVQDGHNDPTTGELYMHGGTITWSKTSGVHPFNSSQNLEYYEISSFTMPELKVSNHDALLYGHIAIDAEGNVSVSYNPYDDNTERELNDKSVKVGRTAPHKLNDARGTENIAYPIVKIGYNNFWMSKSLHTKCLNDGTPLTDHYETINRTTMSFDKVQKTNEDGDPYLEYPELDKGFLYPYIKSGDFEFDSRHDDTFDTYPLLYNFVAFSDEKFTPRDESVDITGLNRFITKIPDDEEIGAILNYFGVACASKLMSAAFRPAIKNEYDKVYDLRESFLNKCYTDNGYNFYVANVSGFNLHALGGFTGNSFNSDLGRQLSMWLLLPEEERFTTSTINGTEKTILNLALLRFDNYSAFSKEGNLDQIVHKISELETGDYSKIPLKHQMFYPVRFFMRMKYQQNTNGLSTNAIKSILQKSTGNQPRYTSQQSDSKIVNVRISKSAAEK